MDGRMLALFVRHGDVATLTHAVDLAVVAVAGGDHVLVALFFDGLAGWRRHLQAGDAVAEAIGKARALAGDKLVVWACSRDAEDLCDDPDALIAEGVVDDVLGLPTIWRRAAAARTMAL